MFTYSIIILIVAVLLGAGAVLLANRIPKYTLVLQIFFVALILGIGFLLILRVFYPPINFENERNKRENAAIERLKDIRKVQEAYKKIYQERRQDIKGADTLVNYAKSWDELIQFAMTDSFNVKKYIVVKPWAQDEISKEDAVKQGILEVKSRKVNVLDSLFGSDFPIEEIRYVPYSDPKIEFQLKAKKIPTGSNVDVDAFVAYVEYEDLFKGLDKQQVINYIVLREKIINSKRLQVGSIEKANNNAGNWEK